MARIFHPREKLLVILGLQIHCLTTLSLAQDDATSTSTSLWIYPTAKSKCERVSELIYSPFTPYVQSEYFSGAKEDDEVYDCWSWTICILGQADEVRKQQFAAVSLVMGLVPLTLKDIAWPERRIISISRRPSPPLEVIVRALGIVPSIATLAHQGKQPISTTRLYALVRKLSRTRIILFLTLSALGLALTYAAFAIIEIYSKRSSLGCKYPIVVLTWHLLAVIPAGIETLFHQRSPREPSPDLLYRAASNATPSPPSSVDVERHGQPDRAAVSEPSRLRTPLATRSAQATLKTDDRDLVGLEAQIKYPSSPPIAAQQLMQTAPIDDTSAIQGHDQPWPLQLTWSIYYIAGMLAHSSIMAVTVLELFVWVMTSVAATTAGKFLAFFLCVLMEKKWELAPIHQD